MRINPSISENWSRRRELSPRISISINPSRAPKPLGINPYKKRTIFRL